MKKLFPISVDTHLVRNSFWLPQVPGGPEKKTFWFSIRHFFNVWTNINRLGLHFKICFFFSSNESLLLFSVRPFKCFWCATIPTFLEPIKSRQIAPWQMQKHFLQLNDPKQVLKKDASFSFSSTRARACQLYENIFMTMPGWELVVNEPTLSFVCKVVS